MTGEGCVNKVVRVEEGQQIIELSLVKLGSDQSWTGQTIYGRILLYLLEVEGIIIPYLDLLFWGRSKGYVYL